MTVDVDIYDQNDNKVEIDKMPGDPIKVSFFSRDQRDKTMADKLMYIPNDFIQNCPFCRLQLVVETFKHLA